MPYNENPDIHSREITWAEYKQLVATGNIEEDKIYFVADLENREDMFRELIQNMETLKQLLQN